MAFPTAPVRGSTATPPPLAPCAPEVVLRQSPVPQTRLPLASAGILRWVWEGKFGAILIEVVGDQVFVNGQLVERHEP